MINNRAVFLKFDNLKNVLTMMIIRVSYTNYRINSECKEVIIQFLKTTRRFDALYENK